MDDSPAGLASNPDSRVLVVEDNLDIAAMLTLVLEDEGYSVAHTSSGIEAIMRFARESFDLVLLDVEIDDLSGEGVGRAMLDLRPAPIVVMSGSTGPWIKRALEGGAVACLAKPFSVDVLVSLVKTLIGTRPYASFREQVVALDRHDLDRISAMAPAELDALPFGVITIDATGRIAEFNAYEQNASGLDPARVIGEKFSDIVPCAKVKRFLGAIEEGVATRSLDRVLRFVFPHRTALAVVSVRLYFDPQRNKIFVFVARHASALARTKRKAA